MPDIAVLMPKQDEFNPVFESIEQLCGQLGFSAKRINPVENISDPNIAEIKNAVATVVDISKNNFDMAIGIGICLAHDKVMIPISTGNDTAISKAFCSGELITYMTEEEGLKKMQKDLYRALKAHKSAIKEDVKHLLKKQEVSYGTLESLGENERGCSEYKLAPEDMIFLEISDGPFLFGKSQKREELNTFLIGKYLLSNHQWHRFLEATHYNWKGHWLGRPKGKLKRVQEYPKEMANYPIVDLSFYDLQAYTDWLNKEFGDKEIYFTIPTEKQWEKAARGTDGRRFPWGNEMPNHEYALYEQDLRHGTAPADSFEKGASPYGCLHMAGNVLEWTQSFYDFDYKSRVVRGGSYAIEPLELECITKFSRRPEIGHWTTGGRVAILVW